jgi:predicted regulator of Ras-like GTPase activity (Roadblock/LC7/MglB family)
MQAEILKQPANIKLQFTDPRTSEPPRTRFEQALKTMNQRGKLQSATLVTIDGLPIATVPASHDSEATDSMIAVMRGVINRIQHQLRLAQVDEISLIGGDGQRLVCRYFAHGGEEFILAFIAPPDQHYRRVTTQAIHSIKKVLSGNGGKQNKPH